MRLGETLVARGAITAEQLDRALEAQIIFGGHLGTCLIEQGSVDERTLGQILCETFGLGFAGPEVFQKIPLYVIESLPTALAERHRVVPFRRKDRCLDVAMIDPKDLRVLDDIRFASGCDVTPWIAPEVRIYQALERYYDVPRRMRFVKLCQQLDETSGTGAAGEKPTSRKPTCAARRATRHAAPAPRSAPASAAASAVVEPNAQEFKLAIEGTTDLFCRVRSEAQVADVALESATSGVDRAILFRVKSWVASVWSTRGYHPPLSDPDECRFSIQREPLLALVRGETLYRDKLPQGEQYAGFYDTLGVTPPSELILVPIHIEDRLVAMFYGDSGLQDAIRGDSDLYQRLARKIGLAMNLVRVKREIRAL